jgi:acyl carrier protein
LSQLVEIVARVFDIKRDEVVDGLTRGKFEVWDSLNHLLLISEIESELAISFTTDEVLRIKTFKDLREIVESKK